MNLKTNNYKPKIGAFLLLLILFYSCTSKNKKAITIATSSNMQFVLKEISTEFTKQTGIECITVIGSSGKLTAQIKEGAPYDVFISADMKFPNELHSLGFSKNKPRIYAYGKLAMWTLIDSIIPSFEILQSKDISNIAVANPRIAPYGYATFEVLKNKNLLEKIEEKLVFGESISQTNQFITTKAVKIGFTAQSVIISQSKKGNFMLIDESLYTPISQGVVILKSNKNNYNNSEIFYNFLFSNDCKEILDKFDYSLPN